MTDDRHITQRIYDPQGNFGPIILDKEIPEQHDVDSYSAGFIEGSMALLQKIDAKGSSDRIFGHYDGFSPPYDR